MIFIRDAKKFVPACHKAQLQYAIYADQRSAAWGDRYSIVDPETGAGAYLIEGKGNGGEMTDVELYNSLAGLGSFFFAFIVFLGTGPSLISIIIFGAALVYSMKSHISTMEKVLSEDPSEQRETKIAATTMITMMANIIKPAAGASNTAAKMLGWLISILSSIFWFLDEHIPPLINKEK